jgi:HSP20 family molecular chaperone IbpA
MLLSAAASVHGTVSVMQMFDEMDQQMDEMHKQMDSLITQLQGTQSHKIDAPDYNISFQEKQDALAIMLSLSKKITSDDISIEMEDGVLDVLVRIGSDRVELKIFGSHVTIYAETVMQREQKNDKGHVNIYAAGSSHMSQSLPLPVKIDLQRRAPQADLTNGVLTITVAKKAAQKIPVTTADSSAPAGEVALPEREETIDFEK